MIKITKYNLNAEMSVLGSILKDNDLLCQVIDKIEPSDFYVSKHVLIYDTMKKIYAKNKIIDIVTLTEELGTRLQEVGGITYIASIIDSTLVTRGIEEYVCIIKEKSNLRKLQKIILEATRDIESSNKECKELVYEMHNRMFSISSADSSRFIDDNELVGKTFSTIQTNLESGGGILGMATGISALDKAINGLQKQKLYVIAGKPGMCKSAFALNILQNLSNRRIAYFSLEMTEEEIGLRRLAMISYIDSAIIERGIMNEEQWKKVAELSACISNGKIMTCTKEGISSTEIRTLCKKLQLQGGLDGLIIDHINILDKKDLGANIREQTTNICMEFKNMAKEFNIPVIILSQLNRACDARPDKRPMLSDLKESSGIEENADVVMMLYRDDYYDKESEEKNVLEVLILKQRGGRTGKIKLRWLPEYQKISDIIN